MKSFTFPLSASFFDIISLIDKIQRPYKNHNLTSHDLKTSLYLFEAYRDRADSVWIRTFPAYSMRGFKYKSKGTILTLHNAGGQITRAVLPEAVFAHGPRYTVHLCGNVQKFEFTTSYYISDPDPEHIILSSISET